MKKCTKCLIKKSDDSFSWKVKSKGRRSPVCKVCHKDYRDKHYLDNKDYYVDRAKEWKEKERVRFYSWLKTQHCLDCGNSDFRVLDFDHINDDKSFNIAEKVGNVTLETLMIEINKCEIVCANCHRIRTAERGDFYKYLAS